MGLYDVESMIEYCRLSNNESEQSRWEKHLVDIHEYLKHNPNKSFDSVDKTGNELSLINDGETYIAMGRTHIIATTVDIDNETEIYK